MTYEAFQKGPKESSGDDQANPIEISPIPLLFSLGDPMLTAHVVDSTFERNIVQGKAHLHPNIPDPVRTKTSN